MGTEKKHMLKTEVVFFSQSELSLLYHQLSRASCFIASLAAAVCIQVQEQQLGWSPAISTSTLRQSQSGGVAARGSGSMRSGGRAHGAPCPRGAGPRCPCTRKGVCAMRRARAGARKGAVCEQGTCIPESHGTQNERSKPREV